MKHYLTGFFMAWGNFCSLPCPCKRWDNDAKSLMLGFLPSVGLIIGAIWAALYFAAVYFGIPYLVVAFLVTFLPFALCGFMHMDGFMDCSDAILSRRPLEERQRILKDSHTGAFAVVSIAFLILAYFSFASTAITIGIDFANMILLVCLSRSVSGLHVLLCRPMKTSQYAQMTDAVKESVPSETDDADGTNAASDAADGSRTEATAEKTIAEAESRDATALAPQSAVAALPKASQPASKKQGIVLLLVQLVIYLALAFWCSSYPIVTTLLCLFCVAATCLAILYARKQLGGMSGDIAGYGIVWGELFGMLALALF